MGIYACEQADDSERLILEHFDVIRDSPSHIYHSALPLSPSSSWLRKCYEAAVAGEVRVPLGLPDRWDACSRTIFLEDTPRSFAYCGDTIAVGVGSNIVLLDSMTGVRVSVLSDHTDKVEIESLASSLDGRLLLSRNIGDIGNYDHTVKLWDVQTGRVINTFDHTFAHSASISSDGTTIALGASKGVILLWDIRTWKCHPIETGRNSAITVIKFSPIDSQRLLSSSLDGTVCQWNVDGHQIGTSHHEKEGVMSLAYSLDGTRFVSCGRTTAVVRDSESGEVVVKLDAPDLERLTDCCLSPDGRFVAWRADTVVYVWNITTLEPRLVGHVKHSDYIAFIAFPSSLISGSYDRSLKFWRTDGFVMNSITTDHTATLHSLASIESVNPFAKEGIIVTSTSSGVVKTWDLTTGTLKSSFSTPAKGKRATHLTSDSLIIVWWAEQAFHIWDVYKGQLLRMILSTLYSVKDLKISGDGTKIFGLGYDRIQAVSMQTGEETGCVELGNGKGFSFFVRGSKVGIDNRYDRGWDFGGPTVSDMRELPDRPCLEPVNWPMGREARPCWIEDTVRKRRIFHLPERYTKYGTKVEWDGRFLLVLLRSAGEVVVMDFGSVCY